MDFSKDNKYETRNFKKELHKLGVPKNYYSLEEGLEEKLYLVHNSIRYDWEVYFLEKGTKYDLVRFENETAACNHFLSIIKTMSYEWKK